MKIEQDLVFWPACVAYKPFREQVEAATAGGFTSMAIAPEDYFRLRGNGLSAGEVRRIAADAGVPVRHLDTVTGWAPIRAPEWAPPEMLARFDIELERSLEICANLELTNLVAVAGYPPESVAEETLVAGFADLCERAEKAGIWVDLEFMPILGLPDLGAAWAIVEKAGHPNSGIMIDTWHFQKSGSDPALLDQIPDDRLRSIQLSDGFHEQRAENLIMDMLLWRAFPGQGEFPVAQMLRRLAARGSLRHIGSEVFSAEANELSAAEAGRRSGETLRATVVAAGMAPPA